MPPDGAQRHAKKQRAALVPKSVGREKRPMVRGSSPESLTCVRGGAAQRRRGCKPCPVLCFGESGGRVPAGKLSLFGVKKRRKNRHRFDAVDADQGCGPGPGVCGHLTTAYSGPGGPEQGRFFKSHKRKSVATHGLPLAAVVGKWFKNFSLFTGPQAGEEAVVRWPHLGVWGRSPSRRPPHRNGGTFRFLLVTKGRTSPQTLVCQKAPNQPKRKPAAFRQKLPFSAAAPCQNGMAAL